jgi:hypothetical protein
LFFPSCRGVCRVLLFLFIMLVSRSCNDCGRQVRLSSTIQPPRCPACRLSNSPPNVVTRPCFRCDVPIPAQDTTLLCANCQSTPIPYVPCFDCRQNFLARPGVTRCSHCRSRTSTVVLPPVDFTTVYSTSFNPSANSFRPLNNLRRKRRRLGSPSPRASSPHVEASSEIPGIPSGGILDGRDN